MEVKGVKRRSIWDFLAIYTQAHSINLTECQGFQGTLKRKLGPNDSSFSWYVLVLSAQRWVLPIYFLVDLLLIHRKGNLKNAFLCSGLWRLVKSPNPPRKNEKRKKNSTFSEKIKNKFLPWQAEHLNLLEDRNIF